MDSNKYKDSVKIVRKGNHLLPYVCHMFWTSLSIIMVNINSDHKLCVSECLLSEDVKEVFCLCSKGELNKYRVPRLLQELSAANITVHHTPFPDGLIPSINELVKITDDLHILLMNRKKTVIQYVITITLKFV